MGTASTMTTRQFREFAGAVLRALPDDLDPTTAQRWIENQESLRRVLHQALTPDGNKQASNLYPVYVDYDLSVEDAVKLGRYDWANSDITSKHFPTQRTGTAQIEVRLVHFDRVISTDDALRELDRMGLRPAELHELLTLGATHPNLQRKFPVIALGSVWQDSHDDRYCAFLDRNGSKRNLNLNWIENDWNENCRFAAVRYSLHALPFAGLFGGAACLYQPPSIRPICVRCSER